MKKLPRSITRNAVHLSPSLKPKTDLFIMFVSETGEAPWTPIHRSAVPDWVKDDPEVMGQLRNGMIAHRGDSQHYRVELQVKH